MLQQLSACLIFLHPESKCLALLPVTATCQCAPGKADESSATWIPSAHLEDLQRAAGFVVVRAIWDMSQQMEGLSSNSSK